MGYGLWGRKESDTTERLHFHIHRRTNNHDALPSLKVSTKKITLPTGLECPPYIRMSDEK